MITPVQRKALVFIASYIAQHGVSPSYAEIRDGLELKSKNCVHRSVTSLVVRGMLCHLPGYARTLSLTPAGQQWALAGVDEGAFQELSALLELHPAPWRLEPDPEKVRYFDARGEEVPPSPVVLRGMAAAVTIAARIQP